MQVHSIRTWSPARSPKSFPLRPAEEVFAKEIIMAGVLSIQAGNNPRVVEMQLLSFLSTKQQAAIPKAA